MVCSCILGDGFPIMILGYTGRTVISETHHFQCHIRITFCFYICKIQQKTSKQVAKGSTPRSKKNSVNLTPTISHRTIFLPFKKTTPTTTTHRTWPYQLGLVRKGHGLCHPCFGHFKFGTKLFTDARGTWRVTTKEGSLVSLKQPGDRRWLEMVDYPP